ncbi:YdcF family protein [Domibacillus sp. DTU_2020_1001157_1_SI_ALB_TIR_016]|uniref:YdcF family protein n=1 Tax=Domibacillus sp. DTU_2020_1001157_1_SI_ALB_TIR_016 TaxID=3077789 RepID=UPI0028EBAE59|nr:YdcF family protein [Domibacillus sp. DTU_2020_1001157_1_SI_ALB_TIR_016]WNS81190.1 YdcF family protein [Domibacillus sp. DTU_2020_1001157_1_SI_ALB_TIR_016]
MMRKKEKYGLLVVIGFLIVFLFARWLLIVDEEPKQADVIMALSGDAGRLEKAADLYHKGYAEKVMLSNSIEAGTTLEEATALGVPEPDIILEEEATSTYTNAVYTKKLMEEQGFDSAVVVSSDYHMGRVKLIYERTYRDTDIELTYVASLRSDKSWYLDKTNILFTAKEYIKLLAYILGLYKFIDL